MDYSIVNNAQDLPFSFIVQDIIAGNLERSAAKLAVFKKMEGIAAIDLPDIAAAVTLIFQRGKLTLETGIVSNPAIIIKTSSDIVTDLNLLKICCGLPCYFNASGRRVLRHLLAGNLRIKGLFTHPVLLNRFTEIMSVI
ncbi:MAG TPA: hypothetical protein PKZ12_01025 [Smithellaceae bacterium]|nr:hypothetical protein [Smithellaceae bacterium]